MKKLVSLLLATMLLLTCIPLGTLSVSAAISGGFSYTVSNGEATITDYSTSSSYGGVITIPSTLGDYPVTTIGDSAFRNCTRLTSVTIPDSVTSIGDSAFYNCTSLTSVTIPDSVTTLGSSVFSYCESLTSVTIPDSVTSIGHSAFSYCESLTSVTIPGSVTTLGSSVFSYCESLTSVTIPDSVTSIGYYAFRKCTSLTSVTIPDSVTSIGHSAFYNCTSLTSVTIPDSVTSIGDSAFSSTAYYSNSANWENKVLYIGKHLIKVDNSFPGTYTIKAGTLTIADKAFYRCTYLTKVTIPGSVTSISYGAFYSCENLTSVRIGDGVTSIGDGAFRYCTNLTSVTIPSSVKTIENNAFLDCSIPRVYYSGTETQANAISVGSDNELLFYATWYYDACVDTIYHTYTAATCTAPQICEVCGATSGKALGHKYKTVTKKATTTANGYTVKRCSVCDKETGKKTLYKVSSVTLSKTAYTYNGKVQKPTVTVKNANGVKLTEGTSYTVTYSSGCKNAGTYKVTIKLKGNYSDTVTKTFKIKPVDVSKCKITLSATSYTYNGAVKKPTVTVKNAAGTKLTLNGSYTVTYATGRKNVGTYKVTVKMRGNYTGTKTITFKILPTKTSISSLTAGTKKLTVKWAKKTTQVTGYQIQYSTSKSFSSAKTKTITKNSTVSTSLTGLSAKKTYYVRIRTYKTVNGVKIYSGWSTVKSLKTK